MPKGQLTKYIEGGDVLIAEEVAQVGSGAVQMGYCIARDQYMKRDDVGIVYQLNVMPLRHRHLVGATLIQEVFQRAAYGCKLFSCWCAQDIQANWFWESIGFVPLAFRTGSRAKQRIHIFWQRRVRDNDDGPASGGTPYWYPSQTQNGAVAEDRLVLPIPPDTHWRDVKPVVLPGLAAPELDVPKELPGGQPVKTRPEQPKLSRRDKAMLMRSQSQHLGGVPLGKKAVIRSGRIRYVDREDYVSELDAPEQLLEPAKVKKPRKKRQKHDPKFVAAARELRDRYLEQVNEGRLLPGDVGKYDVSRMLEADSAKRAMPQLDRAQSDDDDVIDGEFRVLDAA